MAKGMSIVVLFGISTLASPWPSLRLLIPVMVVTGRFDGRIFRKYRMSFNMVWDVLLSRMHISSSTMERADCVSIRRWTLGGGIWLLYLARSSSISR